MSGVWLAEPAEGRVTAHATRDGARARFAHWNKRIDVGLARWVWTGYGWVLRDDDLDWIVASVRRVQVRAS